MTYIGVNGKPTPLNEAVISVMDHGFMYGMGLFETFRTYGGRPCLLDCHLERLQEGCRVLGIPFEGRRDRLEAEIAELLALNGLEDAYLRLTVSAGPGPLGLTTEPYAEPKVILYVKPLPNSGPELYRLGKTLWRLSTPRNTPESGVRLKSLHYMNNMLARRELAEYERQPAGEANAEGSGTAAVRPQPAEGLMLTAEGILAEGIASNLFFVRLGKLYTPEIGTGILPGITRRAVLELAGTHGWAVEEGRYTWDELREADEVFVTNSIQELVPVTRLAEPGGKEVSVGDGEIGKVTERLLYFYRESVGS